MPTILARRKLREASDALVEMRERDGDMRLDRTEEFNFHLNAFLTATRSVRDALGKENAKAYRRIEPDWRKALDPSRRAFVEAMEDFRDGTVHEGEFHAVQEIVQVDVRLAHSRGRKGGAPMPPYGYAEGATVGVARYLLTVNGEVRPAVDCCQEYWEAMESLVRKFE